jgi:histone H3/H4
MLSLLSLKKIAKKKKIKRISHSALEELRFHLEQEALSIARDSLELAKFAKRHTVMKEDVELAIKRKKK